MDIGAFEDQRETARISGVFFYDLNHNGARDAGEPALAGWTAYYDKNDNGRVDAGEPSATSAADGTYTISGLAAGHYNRIREDRRDGWTRTQPAGSVPARLLRRDARSGAVGHGQGLR